MALKQEVQRILSENQGSSISGERMAEQLSVSRNAIWKAIKALQAEGVEILAVTNKGYCLSEKNDILTVSGIKSHLKRYNEKLTIEIRDLVSSTNTVLKEMAENGMPEGHILIAKEQTAGKGRKGRKFFSPKDGSLYMSVLLRPQIRMEEALFITTAAAVSVARAVEDTSGKVPTIKWVNDIFLNEKKICGILTEASVNMETGFPAYAVLGIGVNIYPPRDGMPKELGPIAGTVFNSFYEGGNNYGNRLAAEILNYFFEYYENLTQKTFMGEYQRRSFLTGRTVTYVSGNVKRRITVLGIDDNAGLIAETEDGERIILDSGEVSVKL